MIGYPDKPSSPRGSSSIVLSVLAVHMRTSQRPWDNMSATAVKATEQNHYDIIVPRDNGQICKQPTDLIPRESRSMLVMSWDSQRPSESLSQLTNLIYKVWSLSVYIGIKDH